MKMSQKHYNLLKAAMSNVYQDILVKRGNFALTYDMANFIFWIAIDDLQYDNTHPRYKKGRRYYPHIPDFMNDYDYKDSHIDTAIFNIQKEILVENKASD